MQLPLLTLRIEHIKEDLENGTEMFVAMGLPLLAGALNEISNVSTDVNRSTNKFSVPKPLAEPLQYRRVSDSLQRDLHGICDRYGYVWPDGFSEPAR